jgi:hypothetical protein
MEDELDNLKQEIDKLELNYNLKCIEFKIAAARHENLNTHRLVLGNLVRQLERLKVKRHQLETSIIAEQFKQQQLDTSKIAEQAKQDSKLSNNNNNNSNNLPSGSNIASGSSNFNSGENNENNNNDNNDNNNNNNQNLNTRSDNNQINSEMAISSDKLIDIISKLFPNDYDGNPIRLEQTVKIITSIKNLVTEESNITAAISLIQLKLIGKASDCLPNEITSFDEIIYALKKTCKGQSSIQLTTSLEGIKLMDRTSFVPRIREASNKLQTAYVNEGVPKNVAKNYCINAVSSSIKRQLPNNTVMVAAMNQSFESMDDLIQKFESIQIERETQVLFMKTNSQNKNNKNFSVSNFPNYNKRRNNFGNQNRGQYRNRNNRNNSNNNNSNRNYYNNNNSRYDNGRRGQSQQNNTRNIRAITGNQVPAVPQNQKNRREAQVLSESDAE